MHPKKPDPKTGQRFGKLVIIKELEYSTDSAKHKFLAKCDCGNEKIVTKFALMSNGVCSCGCGRIESIKKTNNTQSSDKIKIGDKFGRLVVLEIKKEGGFRHWRCKCKCECGGIKETTTFYLLQGRTQSCGCLQKERTSSARKKEIEIGTRFGRLVVLKEERLEKEPKALAYRCKCDCGNECVIRAKLLKNGMTQSCGCFWKEAIYEAQDKKASVTDPKRGDIFGHLTVIEMVKRDSTAQHTRCVRCLCDCGKEVVVPKDQLICHMRVSCGCSKFENILAQKKENRKYPAELRDNLYYDKDKVRFDNKDILSTDIVTFKCSKCGEPFELEMQSICKVSKGELDRSFLCSKCIIGSSMQEDDVYNYILSLGINEKDIIRHDRKFLGNKQEIDMFIPSKKLAIEYNGAYWHTDDKRCRTSKYHYNKFNICESKGVRLLTIFDLDWNNNNDCVKDIIKKALGLCENILSSNDCVVEEIAHSDAEWFLNEYNIDNVSLNCEINVAIKHGNELVFVASFYRDKHDCFVLNSYAEKNNVVVYNMIGLVLDYVMSRYNPTRIKAYSNNDYGDGEAFNKYGFECICNADNYFWLMGTIGIYKYEIKDFLDRHSCLVLEAKSKNIPVEKYVMEKLGCVKSTRCGFKKWTFVRGAEKGE